MRAQRIEERKPMPNKITKLELQRHVRNRAERIRLNRMIFVRTKERRLIPFEELPPATSLLSDDADLERFLLRNNLFNALSIYREAQRSRAQAQA